jgi:GTP pyrophosphokinase
LTFYLNNVRIQNLEGGIEMLEKVRALLEGAENRETFFRRIASFLPPKDPRYQMILMAYDDAKFAFKDLKRADGKRYFEHLRAVDIILFDYLRVRDPVKLTAGLLHDINEEFFESWTIERIKLRFGDEVALLVDYLSKPSPKDYPSKEERLKVYHDRFASAPRDFFIVKLADRLHNLLTTWDLEPEKIARKIEETKRHYLPYAEKHIILIHELEEAIKEAIKELEKSK